MDFLNMHGKPLLGLFLDVVRIIKHTVFWYTDHEYAVVFVIRHFVPKLLSFTVGKELGLA
jgi:hypothetical protein